MNRFLVAVDDEGAMQRLRNRDVGPPRLGPGGFWLDNYRFETIFSTTGRSEFIRD
jgi:hypothetical protein